VDSTVYSLTYVMGFVVTGAFILLFLLLIIFQSAVREHHSQGRRSHFTEGEPFLSCDILIVDCSRRGNFASYFVPDRVHLRRSEQSLLTAVTLCLPALQLDFGQIKFPYLPAL
jgi:hypothetical protein